VGDPLATALQLSPAELFGQMPSNRVGEWSRRELNEVLRAAFRNIKDSANIFSRLQSTLAERFGVRFPIRHDWGTGTM